MNEKIKTNLNPKQALAAYSTFNKDVLVSAGAGSGKTQVLSTRVENLVSKGIKPTELLVLTFTNAAALEMRERCRKKLYEREDLRKYIPLLEQAYFQTFDAFNLSLLKKYYYALDISKDIAVCDSSVLKSKKKEIITKILEDNYLNPTDKFINYLNYFTGKKDDSLVGSLLNLIDKIDKKEDSIKYLETYMDNYFSEDGISNLKNGINQMINSYKEDYINLLNTLMNYTGNEEKLQEISSLTFDLKISNGYNEVYSLIENTKLPQFSKKTDDSTYQSYKKKYISSFKTDFDKIFLYDNLDEYINDYMLMKDNAKLFIDILLKYYKEIYKFEKEYALYEFNDIQKLAIKLLKENEDIRLEVKNSFKEILIDEYQDTSDLQEEFISLFSNNNRFLVGDIKQSIYRFRNANPDIFRKKYLSFKRIEPDTYDINDKALDNAKGLLIDMNQNYRSRSEVLSDINNIFSNLMTLEIGDADYIKSHMMEYGLKAYEELKGKDKNEYNSDLIIYDKMEGSKLDEAYYEGYIIALDILKRLKNKQMVYDKELKKFRLATFSDFAVILDRKNHFDTIIKILEYYNIPSCLYQDITIKESHISKTIINLLKVVSKVYLSLYDTEFKHSFTSILRSFLIEISDDSILKLLNENLISNPYIEKAKKLTYSIDKMDNVLIYELILEEFDFYKKVTKMANIDNALHEVEFIKDKIEELSEMGYHFTEVAAYLSDVIENSDDIKYSLDTKGINGVKIMNIHKSKGLEFPICYFADFNHDYNSEELKSDIGLLKEYGIFLPIYKGGKGDTILKSLFKFNFKKETVSERLRLFYVALTRAREKMIFIYNKDLSSDNEYLGIPSSMKKFSNYFDYLLNKNNKFFDNIINLDEAYFNNIDENSFNKEFETFNLKPSEEVIYTNLDFNNKYIEESHISKTIKKVLNDIDKEKLEVGTKYHQVMEMIDFNNPHDSLNSMDIDINIKNRLKKVIDTNILKDINKGKALPEHEFYCIIDNESYHGIIDLLVIYSDHIDIIDYKLKNIDDQAYKRQLTLYAKYVRTKSSLPIKCYLLSLLDSVYNEVLVEV